MRLKELIKSIGDYQGGPLEDFQVKGISCNSKTVSAGYIFVAIKGTRQDGSRFISEAVKKGARLVIVQSSEFMVHSFKKAIFIHVKDARKALAELAAAFYGYPSRKIKIAGITGTNGKTTISYLVESILKEAGLDAAVIGTINYRFADKIVPAINTTPGPIEIQSLLAEMLESGVEYAAMEVSSHALDQNRIEGVDFSSAIFTNFTQDHLDYHLTMEKYFLAKAKLFKSLNKNAFAVLNNDDPYSERIKKITAASVITYAIEKEAEVMAIDIKLDISATNFSLICGKAKMPLTFRLIGKHNVYNALAAAAWGIKEELPPALIKSALEKFKFVPGRLERIDCAGGNLVFVDYAHTEDALANVIKTLRQVSKKRIIVVFGCGGDRDKSKRPKMGRVVSELADFAVITSDNPRSEKPLSIIEDIKRGINKNNYCVIFERIDAIRESLSMAGPQDVVLIAGKGHENYQVLKDRIIHFDDCEAVKECLR
jgi:UDP-N-acetylmuramoyl-L-alanyl-D-glutamate--2,6-diaminopimelate ligase